MTSTARALFLLPPTHAKRATLRDRVVDVTGAEELDLGDLAVEVE